MEMDGKLIKSESKYRRNASQNVGE